MTDAIHIKTNPDVLRWARESLVISKPNAAKSIAITLNRLDQIESGQKSPSMDELKAMAKAYKRTVATLLLQSVPAEKPMPKDHRTVNSEILNKFHDKTILAVRKARALLISLLELREELGLSLQRFSVHATMNDSPAELARALRQQWGLDEIRQVDNANLALGAYIEKIESLGIAVFQLSMPQDGLRGFSLIDESIPIIAIKRGGEPHTAKIFTLFHELGHVILNEGGICNIDFNINEQQVEKWCNAFAAEILVPTAELLNSEIVRRYIANNQKFWTRKDLSELAAKFHVGLLSMLRCILDNNLTTANYYKEKHQAWNKPSFGISKTHEGRNLPKETLNERGRTYFSLAFKAYDQNKIDLKDLSDFLGLRLSYIPRARQLLNA
ncbi:MAG: XRE family transcriptional regulator [Bacteroidales bacterium]|jgi:Zn-dependent peptidase ImmA (M78 family)/transcriptional regulator with XRE-family HTH domain|nr:XRE family transcriptional regulator [Bacteroidales bacterium]